LKNQSTHAVFVTFFLVHVLLSFHVPASPVPSSRKPHKPFWGIYAYGPPGISSLILGSRIFPIYVRQRTEPLAEKRDYGTEDSQCGAEHEFAAFSASHWHF
jgi:hypothetical protein